MRPASNAAISPTDVSPAYVDTAGAGRYLGGMAQITLRQWRQQGRGPTYFKCGRKCYYKIADLDDFMEQHRVTRGQQG